MKKITISLAVLLVTVALAWAAYKRFDSAIAGYMVAVVGAAATIVPIFLPSETVRKETKTIGSIRTSGPYSPGNVEGDYTVNQPPPPKENNERR